MKFYGNGIVWDKSNNKPLFRFNNGVFETDEKTTIDKLIKSGYKHDGDFPEESIKEEKPIPKPAPRKKKVVK